LASCKCSTKLYFRVKLKLRRPEEPKKSEVVIEQPIKIVNTEEPKELVSVPKLKIVETR
jgi:hypothetical protein